MARRLSDREGTGDSAPERYGVGALFPTGNKLWTAPVAASKNKFQVLPDNLRSVPLTWPDESCTAFVRWEDVMFRMPILAAGVLLAAASVVHAQQSTPPPVPEDALAPRELIAWSNLQTPQPAQQQPVSQTRTHEPNQDSRRAQPQAAPQSQQQPAQSQNAAQPPSRDSRTRMP